VIHAPFELPRIGDLVPVNHLRRLFSTFAAVCRARLLMRLLAALDSCSWCGLLGGGLPTGPAWPHVCGRAGVFLPAGLWTPIAGVLVASSALDCLLSGSDVWASILLGTLGAPGCSRTRRMSRRPAFGWKALAFEIAIINPELPCAGVSMVSPHATDLVTKWLQLVDAVAVRA